MKMGASIVILITLNAVLSGCDRRNSHLVAPNENNGQKEKSEGPKSPKQKFDELVVTLPGDVTELYLVPGTNREQAIVSINGGSGKYDVTSREAGTLELTKKEGGSYTVKSLKAGVTELIVKDTEAKMEKRVPVAVLRKISIEDTLVRLNPKTEKHKSLTLSGSGKYRYLIVENEGIAGVELAGDQVSFSAKKSGSMPVKIIDTELEKVLTEEESTVSVTVQCYADDLGFVGVPGSTSFTLELKEGQSKDYELEGSGDYEVEVKSGKDHVSVYLSNSQDRQKQTLKVNGDREGTAVVRITDKFSGATMEVKVLVRVDIKFFKGGKYDPQLGLWVISSGSTMEVSVVRVNGKLTHVENPDTDVFDARISDDGLKVLVTSKKTEPIRPKEYDFFVYDEAGVSAKFRCRHL